jgi:methanogenic corrinoid protein MtbC1
MVKLSDLGLLDLPEVSPEATKSYAENRQALVESVNDGLRNHDDLDQLIGDNPLELMYSNHENHARFMANVFKLGNYSMMARTIIWVYKTYHERGFSYDYFPVELESWIEAVKELLKQENASEITKIYSFLINNHSKFVALSQKDGGSRLKVPEEWQEASNEFLKALLDGNHREAMKITDQKVNNQKQVGDFFENMISPAMYEIGSKWEEGKISVADEHLASSIVSRVLSTVYSRFITYKETKGKAVVTAAANEFHEIGSRIIADSLELDGWDVDHLGVDTPITDLVEMLIEKKPFLLGLSVAIPFNLDNALETIERVRSVPELENMKILIGGKAFNDNPDLWKKTGADAYGKDSKKAIKVAESWWREAERKG